MRPVGTQHTISEHKTRINNLKRKLADEAYAKWTKKAKKSKSRIEQNTFPSRDLVGQTVKHKYEITTRNGKVTTKWYKGKVLGIANEEEIMDASEEDREAANNRHLIFIIHYEKHAEPEAIALQTDWESDDVQLYNIFKWQ